VNQRKTSGQRLPPGPDYANALLVEPTQSLLYYGMQRSADGGMTWSDLTPPARDAYLLAVALCDSLRLLAGVANLTSGLFLSGDGGKQWREIGGARDHPPVFAAAFARDGSLWLATRSGLFRLEKAELLPA